MTSRKSSSNIMEVIVLLSDEENDKKNNVDLEAGDTTITSGNGDGNITDNDRIFLYNSSPARKKPNKKIASTSSSSSSENNLLPASSTKRRKLFPFVAIMSSDEDDENENKNKHKHIEIKPNYILIEADDDDGDDNDDDNKDRKKTTNTKNGNDDEDKSDDDSTFQPSSLSSSSSSSSSSVSLFSEDLLPYSLPTYEPSISSSSEISSESMSPLLSSSSSSLSASSYYDSPTLSMKLSFKELTIVNPPPLFVNIEIPDNPRRSLYKRTVSKVPIDELIHFINERQKIFIKKSKGLPFPYTEDEVLSKFRFTNVFREDDITSVIITNILSDYEPTDEFYIVNLIIHRLVSRKSINKRLKYIRDIDEGWAILENRRNLGLPVSTNAFQSTITFEARRDQWEKVFEYGKKIWKRIVKRNPQPTLYDAYIELKEDKDIPQIGTFTAWQIACDMLMMGMVAYGDNKAFAVLGPGAEEGLKYFDKRYDFESLLQKVNLNLGSHFEGRTLRGLDLEHILCEFQKYYKATQGDSRGLRKYEDD